MASIRSWALALPRSADDSFQRLTYGGYLMRQGLSQSVPTRIVANRTMERQLLFDIGHPDAFKNTGKFHTSLLDEADFALNRGGLRGKRLFKGNVLQHLLQCARDLSRRTRLRLWWPRHAEQQRVVQGQHLRSRDRKLDSSP